MKKILALLLAVIMVVGVFAGCSQVEIDSEVKEPATNGAGSVETTVPDATENEESTETTTAPDATDATDTTESGNDETGEDQESISDALEQIGSAIADAAEQAAIPAN